MGGAERVLEVLSERFKGPIYTLIQDRKAIENSPFHKREIRTSFLQRIPKASSFYRHLLPLFPSAIQRLDLSEHQLIVSSSFAVAKSIIKQPHQLHICYCHSPMRAAWDLREFYVETLPKVVRPVASLLLDYVREFDRRTHDVVDHFIANSRVVAERIYQHYGREATVIHPPVSVEAFHPTLNREDFFITCSRLVPYKRVDLLIKAFAKMPDKKLLVVGDGPQRYRLESKATRNVEFLGRIPEEALRDLLPKARAFCFAAEEDFGIVMVEAQAAGIPVIAYGKGGSRDAVIAGGTGLFFNEQTVESVCDAVHRFEVMEGDFEQDTIRRHAEGFSKERFLREIEAFIEKQL